MHVSFDTLDLKAILEIIQVLPELHLDRKYVGVKLLQDWCEVISGLGSKIQCRFNPCLCEPDLDQYAVPIKSLKVVIRE